MEIVLRSLFIASLAQPAVAGDVFAEFSVAFQNENGTVTQERYNPLGIVRLRWRPSDEKLELFIQHTSSIARVDDAGGHNVAGVQYSMRLR